MGPSLQPHGLNNGAAGADRGRRRHRAAHSLVAAPLSPSPSTKGAHPPGEQPFFLLRPFAATAPSCRHRRAATKRCPGPPPNLSTLP
jgi:hypothetical protein